MTTSKNTGIFATLCCTRIRVNKESTPIANLSLLFSLIALLTAPWLVIGGIIAAMALGYRFSVSRSEEGFDASFDETVRQAGANVDAAVERMTRHE